MQIVLSLILLLVSQITFADDHVYHNVYFSQFKKEIGADYVIKKYSGSETYSLEKDMLIYTISTPQFSVEYKIKFSEIDEKYNFKLDGKPLIQHYAYKRSVDCLAKKQ